MRTLGFEDTEDFVTGDETHLGDTMRITEGNTDLGGSETLASKFDDVVNDIVWGGLEPCGGCPTVREGRGRYRGR